MALWIKLAEDIFVQPGTNLTIKISEFLDYLRVNDDLLEQDTYLCYLLHKENHAWLSLHVCSSQTLKVIGSYLKDEYVEGFDYTPFSKENFMFAVSEVSEAIEKVLDLRERYLESLSQKRLLMLVARTTFLRAFWKDVLSTYDPVEKRVLINYRSYSWLKENGMANFWMNELIRV